MHFRPTQAKTSGMAEFDDILVAVAAREERAFQRGWKAAVDHILAAAKSAAKPPSIAPLTEALANPPSPSGSEPRRYDPPIIDVVYDIIAKVPGLRGAQIVSSVVVKVPGSDRKAMDRTCRTALARLNKRGRIEKRNRSWFLKKEAEK